MRRVIGLGLALAMLLGACGRQEWMNMRQLCEQCSELAEETGHLVPLEPEQFTARRADDGVEYQAYWNDNLLLTCSTLRNGRVHTVSVTGLPEQRQSEFFDAARCLVQACTAAAPDQAERWLQQVQAGQDEVNGVQGLEENGFRISYAANQAGRWLQISQLRFLPPEPELPTLRDKIS